MVLAAVVVGCLVALAVAGVASGRWGPLSPLSVAVWGVLCAAANLLPVPAARNVYLSMSGPVNVAIATVFAPSVAATVVAVGSVSSWELERSTTWSHALFNRSQLGVAAAAASVAVGGPVTATPAAWRAVLAVVTYHVVNWMLVGTAERAARETALRVVIRRLIPSGAVAAVLYLALGLMGVALAMAGLHVGLWSVALLMVPLLGARQAVNAARAVERAERDRRLLADRLVDERERERLRIAGDIHDVVLQHLAAVRLQTDNAATAVRDGRTDLAVELLTGAAAAVDGTIADLRRSIASLRRTTLDEGGLGATLERYVRAFRAQTGIEATVTWGGGGDPIATATALLLYEACQEALTNVARHAAARRVEVTVTRDRHTVELEVRDDGGGFDDTGRTIDPVEGRGAGLAIVRDKVALAGGGVWVDSRAGEGTRVVIRVPSGPAEDDGVLEQHPT